MGSSDGTKNIAQIIKCELENISGDKDNVFVWKHPCKDFNTTTQLIVHEAQEAIFFMNGQALDLFGPGRHTLETQNIPLLKKALNWTTGGEIPFHCEVYFLNLVEQMSIMWGTDSQVEYMDPVYNFPLSVGASGEMRLQIADSRKLLIKLVGTERELTRSNLVNYFREILNMKMKTYLATVMSEEKISIFDVDKHLETFSRIMQDKLSEDFLEYGIALKRFIISRFQKPNDKTFQRFKDLHYASYMSVEEAKVKQTVDLIEQETQKQKTILEAQGLAEKRRLEGYSFQEEKMLEVAGKMAENEAIGQFTNAGIGMGTMAGVGGGIGLKVAEMTSQAMQGAQNSQQTQYHNTMEEFENKILKLKMMRDAGFLSEEELQMEKTKLIQNL